MQHDHIQIIKNTMGTLFRVHFWPQWHNYQGSKHFSFRQDDVFMFLYISLCVTIDPWSGPFKAPGALFEKKTWYRFTR